MAIDKRTVMLTRKEFKRKQLDLIHKNKASPISGSIPVLGPLRDIIIAETT
jgi:hypothetical protein